MAWECDSVKLRDEYAGKRARRTKDAELLYILWAHLVCLKKICSRPHSAISADGLCEFLRTVIGFVANTTLARAMSSAAGDHCCGLAWRRARTEGKGAP